MSAAIHGLFHVAIKTANLAATRRFYIDVLGLVDAQRPDFGYPGAWLACPHPGGGAIVHVYAGGPALGPEGRAAYGSAAVDHLSLSCSGFADYRARFIAHGMDWREFLVPGTTLWQLFVYDPNGVQMELTFEGSNEAGPPPDMSAGRKYIAGASFFDAATYPLIKP
jgi:catechol 2,3-dioxygenase-like lactoylglutathione lyase family enzyme